MTPAQVKASLLQTQSLVAAQIATVDEITETLKKDLSLDLLRAMGRFYVNFPPTVDQVLTLETKGSYIDGTSELADLRQAYVNAGKALTIIATN